MIINQKLDSSLSQLKQYKIKILKNQLKIRVGVN